MFKVVGDLIVETMTPWLKKKSSTNSVLIISGKNLPILWQDLVYKLKNVI